MQRLKKGLASLLAVLMLVSALPASALAAEEDGNAAEEVVFNLGTMDVTVGSDMDAYENGEVPYDLFDEDGNYTMDLGPDAFFPYEVQFTCGGATWTEWFMDADDTVEVGGHIFSVETYDTDPTAIKQIGVWVDGTYVPAYPERKEFTNDGPGTALMSLLPLTEKNVALDLTAFLPSQLSAVRVDTVLNGLRLRGEDSAPDTEAVEKVAWFKASRQNSGKDSYEVVDRTGTVDLNPMWIRDDHVYLELIAGTALQLDLEHNTRYCVDVNLPTAEMFQWSACAETSGRRLPMDVVQNQYDVSDFEGDYWNLQLSGARGTNVLIALTFSTPYVGRSLTAAIYEGNFATEEAAQAAAAADPGILVTDVIWDQDLSASGGYQVDVTDEYGDFFYLTAVLKNQEGTTVSVVPMEINVDRATADIYAEGPYQKREDSIYYDYVGVDKYLRSENGVSVQTLIMERGYPADREYSVLFRYYGLNGAKISNWEDYVDKAVLGLYDSLESAADQQDIKAQMFDENQKYHANYSGNGVNFTIFGKNGDVFKINVKTKDGVSEPEPEPTPTVSYETTPLSSDTYFRAVDAKKGTSTIDTYVLPYQHDSYYSNGFQTLLTTETDVSDVKLVFEQTYRDNDYNSLNARIFASSGESAAVPQTSGESVQDFSHGPIQYSAAAEDGVTLKNYWVSVIGKHEGGAKLFVNGINGPDGKKRIVFLTDAYNNYHDVFIANVGDAPLTGLKAELIDPVGIKLDDYWTVGGENNSTLAAFTSTSDDDMKNIAKIRLQPTTNQVSEISGTLKITADGQEPVEIALIGLTGTPKVSNSRLDPAVKYVPYGRVIQTTNQFDWLTARFEITNDDLPQGMILKPNGEVYGVAKETGYFSFSFKVGFQVNNDAYRLNYTGDVVGYNSSQYASLQVKENTKDNVENETDMGYELKDRVQDMQDYREQVFRSNGKLTEFQDFWLDGEKLVRDTDYTAENGSTKITISAQTFQNAGSGEHTIAAEFRVGGDTNNALKRTAQVYTVGSNANNNGSNGGNGGNGGGSSGDTDSKPAVKPQKPVEKPKTAADVFSDIKDTDWFYVDVEWAYQNKLMIGVTKDAYMPYNPISPAMVVTVLSRMDKIDLSQYEDAAYEEITGGQWYTAAASWAKDAGLLPEGPFVGQPPMGRGQMAVMLVKYLKHAGIDCTLTGEPVVFTDADQMTAEENEAFQVLYQFGIFKGIGNYTMDVSGATTRAQLAVLMHRVSVFVESQKK